MTKQAELAIPIPYEVTFLRAGATVAQDLGLTTQDGVTLSYDAHLIKKTFDQYGFSPLDLFCAGIEFGVSFTLAQFDADLLKHIMPASFKLSDFESPAKERITIGEIPGRSLIATAGGVLTFHRFGDAANVKTFNIILHKAMCTVPIEVANNHETMTMFPCTFDAFVDLTKPNGNLLGSFGDPSASASDS